MHVETLSFDLCLYKPAYVQVLIKKQILTISLGLYPHNESLITGSSHHLLLITKVVKYGTSSCGKKPFNTIGIKDNLLANIGT